MSQAIVLLDDLDRQSGLRSLAAGTVRFGYDGQEYEIDLTAEHAQDLWEGIKPYIRASRPVTRPAPLKARVEEVEKPPGKLRAISDGRYPVYRGVILYHADKDHMRKYWEGFRAWADKQGISYVRQYPGSTGFDYPQQSVQDYENALRDAGLLAMREAS